MLFTRTNIIALLAIAAVTLGFYLFAAAQPHDGRGQAVAGLALSAPLPTTIPAGTRLIVGDPTTEWVVRHNGWDRDLPFVVQWAQITGGPAVTEAFHARALDIGSAANIPPIHAVWVGIPVRTIAIRFRADPLNHPTFVFAVAPRSPVRSLADLHGRRIAFSPGQAQGEVVLRTLADQGLTRSDVTLVELPSSGDVYTSALTAGAVDIAPIGAGAGSRRYLQQHERDGGRILRHSGFRDDLGLLYVRTETLQDPAKAAALRAYVALWGRAQAWIAGHRAEFTQGYYVGNQGLSPEDAQAVADAAGDAVIPTSWAETQRLQQASIDLMAAQTHQPRFDAAQIFDRRFESVAAQAYAASLAGRPTALAQR